MGEIADDLLDRLFDHDDGDLFNNRGFLCKRGRGKHPKKPAPPGAFDEKTRAMEYPSKKTPSHLLQDYPEKTFDMGFFPKTKPKVEPVINTPEELPWDINSEEPPF